MVFTRIASITTRRAGRHAWPALCALGLAGALATAASQAQAPAPAAARAELTTAAPDGLRSDERRPEQPLSVALPPMLGGQPLQLSGSWDYSDERRTNFDLTRTRARDRRVREHEVKLDARLRPTPDSEVLLQVVGLHESRRTQGTSGRQVSRSAERGQAWVKLERLAGSPWTLQLGRMALVERRSWWWDDDLDAVRLMGSGGAAGGQWRLDTGLSRALARVSSAEAQIDPQARGVLRWFGNAAWRSAANALPVRGRHTVEGFWLLQADRSGQPAEGSRLAPGEPTDSSDLHARWLGLRISGEGRSANGGGGAADGRSAEAHGGGFGGLRWTYWADAAWLRGREAFTPYASAADGAQVAGATGQRRLRSSARDLGATLQWDLAGWRPGVTLAHARGSGGARGGAVDANFRQTGLQENKQRLAGVKRVRRYGALLEPELSNLAITTVGAGLRLPGNSSIELLRHQYRQLVPSSTLVGSRLSTAPQGLLGRIGSEWDLVIALREWRALELTLTWSRFRPGEAFAADRRDAAHGLELGVVVNF